MHVAFGVGFLLVVVAVVGSALKRRPGRREIWVLLGVAAVYGMVVVRIGIGPTERTHLFEYGLVAVLIQQALTERAQHGRGVGSPAIFAITSTALLGWLDEGTQALLPNRVYDLRDVGVNALTGLMGDRCDSGSGLGAPATRKAVVCQITRSESPARSRSAARFRRTA